MVERPDRARVDSADRGREWEVFVRSEEPDPLRHVGSVRADAADDAYVLASRLFAWYAEDVWLCPADETHRYTTHDLADARTPPPPPAGDESRSTEWDE